jgi:tetratricopeptide (TPR) repeat protein
MAKKKTGSPKKTAQKPESAQVVDLNIPFEPNAKQNIIFYVVISLIAAGLSIYYINYALSVNHTHGFPLDDPWIHLTFAKNVAEYQSFSYFQDKMATAGSTSPVYTFMLAAGFIITKNEMILSYVLGIAFLVLSAIGFYKLSAYESAKEGYLALACTAVFLVDKWMNFISVSGMETTMYIFFLIMCAYYYKKRNAVPFAIFLGLILWGRPDGVAFIGAVALDYILVSSFSKKDKSLVLFTKNDLIKIGAVFGGIIVLYFIMNFMLSGSLLPNTYNAKLTYYSPEFRSRGDFFKFEVWDYFTAGAYGLIMAGFLLGSLKMLIDVSKKKYNPNFIYVVFVVALVFIYWYKLPYAHRFGRYMMPIIPFFILVSVSGFRYLAGLTAGFMKSRQIGTGLLFIIMAAVIIMSVSNYNTNKASYADECRYINDRQVAAALWIRDNTKETDVIGTHDVGAIGYYSNRRIVDAAGLITPELINKLNDRNYASIMKDYMKKEGVTYLAFLREWYRVVNQNPLFSTAENLPPEVMEIYKFNGDSTEILNSEAKSMIMYAQDMLAQRQPQQALNVLGRSLSIAPNSSLTYFLMAYGYSQLGDAANFEKSLLKALDIFPNYKDALMQLGNYYLKTKPEEARKYLTRYLEVVPGDKKAQDMLNSISAPVK